MVNISQIGLAAFLSLAVSSSAFTINPKYQRSSSPFINTRQQQQQQHITPYTTLPTPSTHLSASTLTTLPDSAVEVTITATPTQTQKAYDKTLAEVSKSLTIPGFRKGSKIPPAVLENAFASQTGDPKAIRVQALNVLLGELVEPAIKEEHGLDPIGQPVLSTKVETLAEDFVPGEGLEMVVRCDVWPSVGWVEGLEFEKPYYGLTGSYERKPFDEAKYNKALSDLKERYAVLSDMEDGKALEYGDACKVDMVGYMADEDGEKGEPLPNAASGDNVEVILTTGRYMEGLIEGIIGAKVGDTRTINVSFPEKLRDKTLAGKGAIFDVTILSASHRTLPTITDEFAATVRDGLTAATLESELKKAIDDEASKEFIPERNKALSKALAARVSMPVPDTLVTQQAREKYATMMTEFRDQGMDDAQIKKMITTENFLKYKKIYAEGIIDDFKASMAVEEIATLESITVPDIQIEEQMAGLKKEAEKSGDEFNEEAVRGQVENTIKSRLVFDLLAEKAELEVIYKEEEGFDQAMMDKLLEESVEREKKWAEEGGGPGGAVAAQGKTNDDNTEATTDAVKDDDDDDRQEHNNDDDDDVQEDTTKNRSNTDTAKSKYEEEKKARQDSIANARIQPKSAEEEAALAERYGAIANLEERAFQILYDLGMIELTPDPADPDYYDGEDDDYCIENVFPQDYDVNDDE